MTYHRQRDTRWAHLTLGNNAPGTVYTVGNFGCLLTCIAHLCDTTPDVLNVAGVERGCFAPNSGVALTFEPTRWMPGARWRLYHTTDRYPVKPFPAEDLARAANHANAGYPVILEVQWPRTHGQHFVSLIAAPPTSYAPRPYVIADPERAGQVEDILAFYGAAQVAIVRAILYTRADTREVAIVNDKTHQVMCAPGGIVPPVRVMEATP